MAAVFTSVPGEAIMEDAAIEITVNDQFDIRPKEAILLGKALIVDLFQRFKIVLNALIILRVLWPTWLTNGRRVVHGLFFLKQDEDVPDGN
jgi:hypothetical protein